MLTSVERPLEGKLVLVTGGTRGIGAATSLALAGEGAWVVATYRDVGKENRVNEFTKKAEGLPGIVTARLADITRPTHRRDLLKIIELAGGGQRDILDIIISNAAGGMDKQNPLSINSTAKIALIRELAPLLSPRALVVEMESPWSRFYPYVEQLEDYEPVAISKKRGRVRLLREIPQIGEAVGKEIGLAFVCGHAVADTVNTRLLERKADKDKWEQLVASAAGGKLPTTEDMAQAVLRLIGRFYRKDLEVGHTEYVGVPHWKEEEVKRRFYMYGPSSLYVDNTVFHSPTQSFTSTRARPEHFEPLFSPDVGPLVYSAPGQIWRPSNQGESVSGIEDLLASFTATRKHAKDHFTEQVGLQIVPGYKLLAAAALGYGRKLQDYFGESYRWVGTVGETRFIKPVLPGAEVEVYSRGESVTEGGGWASNIELRAAGISVATISGLLMKPGVDSNRHLKGRFIEMAAQAAGAQFLHLRELAGDNPVDLVPLFRSIGPIQFMGVVQPGETIETESRLTEVRKNGFTADTVLRVGDRTIATILGINCGVLRGGMRAIERIKRSIGEEVVN